MSTRAAEVAGPHADSLGADWFDSSNPADGSHVARLQLMGQADVERVVARARVASEWWSTRTFEARRRVMRRWAAEIASTSDTLAELLHREHGKPVGDAMVLEILPALEQIRWAANHAPKVLKGRSVRPSMLMANHTAKVEYRPFGVVGVIGPWNYPVFTPAGSIAYALAAGNTVVLKPSEHTPAAGQFLVDAFEAANPDVPAGVLGIVTGDGSTGAHLCRAGVDKIAFTGSPATGRKIMAACAESLTPVLLECGGKDPMIVAADADVEIAAKEAAWGAMANSGQTCVGIERVYVVASVAERFKSAVAAELKGLRAGSDVSSKLGPMTMAGQVDIVRRHVEDALKRGATPLVGGIDAFRGAFVDPIVLVDVDDASDAIQEETFGPTLTVTVVDDDDEAVRQANSTRYALGASVFSRRRGDEIAAELDAGMVSINSALAFVGIAALPFGGRGESGFGRIHGAEGLREFALTKSTARRMFMLPGMDVSTLHRGRMLTRVIRGIIRLRHR